MGPAGGNSPDGFRVVGPRAGTPVVVTDIVSESGILDTTAPRSLVPLKGGAGSGDCVLDNPPRALGQVRYVRKGFQVD